MKFWIAWLSAASMLLLASGSATALPDEATQSEGRCTGNSACAAPITNRAPVFVPLPVQIASVGNRFELTVMASDPDGGPVRLSAENLPDGATFAENRNGTGTVGWSPAAAQVGIHKLQFRAADAGTPMSGGALDVTINVGDVMNQPPLSEPLGERVAVRDR